MEAKELRLDNLVYYKHSEDTDEVIHSVNKLDIDVNKIYNYKPIPLTEDWLIKFGFKGRVDFKWKMNIGVQIIDNNIYFAFKDIGNVIFHSMIMVKHVHQLQNLYFALTGEGLTIKD